VNVLGPVKSHLCGGKGRQHDEYRRSNLLDLWVPDAAYRVLLHLPGLWRFYGVWSIGVTLDRASTIDICGHLSHILGDPESTVMHRVCRYVTLTYQIAYNRLRMSPERTRKPPPRPQGRGNLAITRNDGGDTIALGARYVGVSGL
jgi:hypothetical protein